MRVTAVDYTTQGTEPVVLIAGRDTDGNRRVHYVLGTEPYLYAPEGTEVPDGHAHKLDRREPGYESFDGVPLERWYTRVPDDVAASGTRGKEGLADLIENPYESDIPYYRRCSIDYDLSGYIEVPDEREFHIDDVITDVEVTADEAIEPRVVFGDIEVLHEGADFEQMVEDADKTVSHVTLYDTREEQYDLYALDEGEIDGTQLKKDLRANDADPDELDIVLHRCPTERALLDSVLGYFEDVRPDLTTGWNWVDFDILYLLRRLKRLYDPDDEDDANLDLDRLSDGLGTKRNFRDYHGSLARAVSCVPAVDMMQLFAEKMVREGWRSKSLDYVAQQVLDRGKISGVNVNDGFEKYPSTVAAYNLLDVELCVGIDEVRGVIDFFFQLAELSQVQIYDVFSEMRLVDGYVMSRADDDEVLPPQPDDADIPENAGGLVLQPSDGISEWVGVMDLKSLYPSSIITWNISPETIDWIEDFDDEPDMRIPWVPEAANIGEGEEYSYPVTDDDVSWDRLGTRLDEEGLIPKYLKRLFAVREEMKDERANFDPDTDEYETWDRKQYAVKVLMNSFYGVSSNDHWRLGKHGLGDAITSASRYGLFKGKQLVERAGYETIYGDTDSVMFSLGHHDKKKKAVLDGKGLTNQVNAGMEEAVRESGLEGDHPFMDEDLPHARDAHCLKYEFEKLYRRYIQFGKKKRYAGNIVWKEGKDVDKVDITGFENKRSDVPLLAAECQKEVLHMVLDGRGLDAVSEYVSGLTDDIRAQDVDLPRIARPKSLGSALDDYDHPTQTVKACRASQDQLDKNWVKGDDPFLVFLNGTPPMTPNVDVIALEWGEDLPDGYVLDAEEHIRIGLELPLKPILDEMGWTWREVKTGNIAGNAVESDWGTASAGTDDDAARAEIGSQATVESHDGDDPESSPAERAGESGGDDANDGTETKGALESDW